MRKSIVFISIVLSTFVLVMLYNVVSAYREERQVVEASTQPAATSVSVATDLPSPTEVPAITPEIAAQLAVQAVGNSNLLSAESAEFNGVNAYKITFTNNDVVYVGLDGQILSVQVAPVVVNVGVPVPVKHKNDQNANGNNSSQESHENEEHEEHED
jgi:hypothetical protein